MFPFEDVIVLYTVRLDNRHRKSCSHGIPLQWRHNERDYVSNHRRLDCLVNKLFRSRSKKKSKSHVTGLCEGNSPVIDEFPAQRGSNAEKMFTYDDVMHDDVIKWKHFPRYWLFILINALHEVYSGEILTKKHINLIEVLPFLWRYKPIHAAPSWNAGCGILSWTNWFSLSEWIETNVEADPYLAHWILASCHLFFVATGK